MSSTRVTCESPVVICVICETCGLYFCLRVLCASVVIFLVFVRAYSSGGCPAAAGSRRWLGGGGSIRGGFYLRSSAVGLVHFPGTKTAKLMALMAKDVHFASSIRKRYKRKWQRLESAKRFTRIEESLIKGFKASQNHLYELVIQYLVSHGLLLLRSNKPDKQSKRIDILFNDVRAMEIRCWFLKETLEVRLAKCCRPFFETVR
jgi:hypothetical protein